MPGSALLFATASLLASSAAAASFPRVTAFGWDGAGRMTGAAVTGGMKPRSTPRGETTYDHDARGLVVEEKLPENATNKYDYTAAGALETYHDPAAEDTSNGNDAIGRPTTRRYADGSTERYTWDGPRLSDYTDRQGRVQRFGYDTADRLTDVYDADHNRID